MKRAIKASEDFFDYDPLLSLEHQVDLAINEAWALYRSNRSNNPFLSSRGKAFAERLQEIQDHIRGARRYLMRNNLIDTDESNNIEE